MSLRDICKLDVKPVGAFRRVWNLLFLTKPATWFNGGLPYLDECAVPFPATYEVDNGLKPAPAHDDTRCRGCVSLQRLAVYAGCWASPLPALLNGMCVGHLYHAAVDWQSRCVCESG
jgi:hypothetical protein